MDISNKEKLSGFLIIILENKLEGKVAQLVQQPIKLECLSLASISDWLYSNALAYSTHVSKFKVSNPAGAR
jgi:hypothetical protein